ncbi:PLP-dependent aminotransferase family protein [Pelosinus sp. sgz500959]|uniref:MocR-like pyridoxine biosynthesis transcription factor PdxR n=1 Tax=Pelosinus sp. sgz500959 TaxID=3242472 RepID=UPI00366D71F5
MDISKHFLQSQLDHKSSKSLYLQIQELITAKIMNHSLPPGTKLPPERELASLFSVSRTTAINTYRQLEQQGLIQTKVGSGTYVADHSPNALNTSLPMPWHQLFSPYPQSPVSSILRELVSTPTSEYNISLAAGMPDPKFYPFDVFSNLFQKNSSSIDLNDLGHISTEGYAPLRQTIAALHCNKTTMPTTPDNVSILSGSQQGLYLLSKIFLQPGDCVVVQSPTYIGAVQVFHNAGVRILTLPANSSFPFSLLEDYLIRYRPKLFYIVPTFQNPNGRVLPLSERQELLRLAARHQLIIVEDDPYSELYYNEPPPPSLKALDNHDGVIYLGTFSKTLFPGLRIGWMVAATPVINRIALEKQYVDLHSSNLSQWLLHLFLQEEALQTHLVNVRKEYKKRRDAMANSIRRHCGANLDFSLPSGGFYLWCKLQTEVTSPVLLHEATKNGVSFVPGEAFYTDQSNLKELRLCFATHSEDKLEEGIKRLAKTLSSFDQQHPGPIKSNFATRPMI